MKYTKSEKYNTPEIVGKIMGPNPIKLTEELLDGNLIAPHSRVCDLGSGMGVTSLFIAREYGFHVYAADLWSVPDENQAFFSAHGLSPDQITAVRADATDLPFEQNFFDAVVSVDSYNYFFHVFSFLYLWLLKQFHVNTVILAEPQSTLHRYGFHKKKPAIQRISLFFLQYYFYKIKIFTCTRIHGQPVVHRIFIILGQPIRPHIFVTFHL